MTVKPIYYDDLGTADYGWLKARYHFSFANYYNPERMGLGPLRVINDDIIDAGRGFPPHDHDNMEIITFVRQGAITHKDSMGNEGRTAAGDIQVMRAGSGITHSEYNREDEKTRLYQIWVTPRSRDLEPAWKAKEMLGHVDGDTLPLLVSGDGKAPLDIDQDVWIYGGRLAKEQEVKHNLNKWTYLLVSEGEVICNDLKLKMGDALQITDESALSLKAETPAEVLLLTGK